MAKKAIAYKLETGVKIPAIAPYRKNRASKYPFETMKAGQSFEAPASEQKRLAGAAQHAKRKLGLGFKVLRLDANTVRVWCLGPAKKAKTRGRK